MCLVGSGGRIGRICFKDGSGSWLAIYYEINNL